MEAAGNAGAGSGAPAPAFSSPDIEAAVKLAIGPAVHAAVQATLAATAAAGGAGGMATSGAAAGGACALAQALQPVVEALQEVTQAVRSIEGQLVRAVQDSTQQLLARMDSHALDAYNVAVNAHNQAQLARSLCSKYHNDNLPLLPRKNSAGELPPAGTFPRSVADLKALTASCHAYVDEIDLKRNERLVKLYRFYGAQANGKPWPAEDDLPAGQHQAVEEFNTRAGYLKTFLRLE